MNYQLINFGCISYYQVDVGIKDHPLVEADIYGKSTYIPNHIANISY